MGPSVDPCYENTTRSVSMLLWIVVQEPTVTLCLLSSFSLLAYPIKWLYLSKFATHSSMATYFQITGPCCVWPDASFVFSHLPASACGHRRNGFIKCVTRQSRLDICSLGCDTSLQPINVAEEFITNLLQERKLQTNCAPGRRKQD